MAERAGGVRKIPKSLSGISAEEFNAKPQSRKAVKPERAANLNTETRRAPTRQQREPQPTDGQFNR
jgi:hypothetical protein